MSLTNNNHLIANGFWCARESCREVIPIPFILIVYLSLIRKRVQLAHKNFYEADPLECPNIYFSSNNDGPRMSVYDLTLVNSDRHLAGVLALIELGEENTKTGVWQYCGHIAKPANRFYVNVR